MFEGTYYAFENKVTRILDQETVLALGSNKTYGIIFFPILTYTSKGGENQTKWYLSIRITEFIPTIPK